MALYHDATVSPTKAELLAEWVPAQPWCPDPAALVEVIGAYRFDDPEGQVGMEAFLVRSGDTVLHVPLTYRDAPVEGAGATLICEMDHSAIGRRWVYDGMTDSRFVLMLAAVSMTGQGEALGMVTYDGIWHIAPTNVRITGGGWPQERVSVDGFVLAPSNGNDLVFRNDHLEMTARRQTPVGRQPAIGLTATWPEHPEAVVLTEIRSLG